MADASRSEVNSLYDMSNFTVNSTIPGVENLSADQQAGFNASQKQSINKVAEVLREMSAAWSTALSGGHVTMPSWGSITPEEINLYKSAFMPRQRRAAQHRTATTFNARNKTFNRETKYVKMKQLFSALPVELRGIVKNFVIGGGKRKQKKRKTQRSKSRKTKRR